MLVERSDIHFPVSIYNARNTGGGQDVKRKILPLAAWHFRVAVDAARAYTARDVRNESPVRLDKVVAKPHVESEVVILDSFENRLRHGADIELMIPTQPAVTSNDSPADAFCEKERADLIIRRRINRTKQIAGLECEFDSVRIKFVGGYGLNVGFWRTAEERVANADKQQHSACASILHSRATIGTLDRIAIGSAARCAVRTPRRGIRT